MTSVEITKGKYIPNSMSINIDNAEDFFSRVIDLWSISLPDERRLGPKQKLVVCYMLGRSDGTGNLVDYTYGVSRKQLQKDLRMSRQAFSGMLKQIVDKRWIHRRHDDYLSRYIYSFSRELLTLRHLYFTDDYKGMEIKLKLEF